MILDSNGIKELFLSIVKRAKTKYSFRLENFCIMGNHFHFIIKPGRGENLSAIMQWILAMFARKYNKVFKLTGHVWGSRFFSKIISSFDYFLRAFAYIDDNPEMAGQVIKKQCWRWGGLWHHRSGWREIVDDLEPWMRPYFLDHEPILIGTAPKV
jgi:Transposase and inactivated derivatives